MIFKPGDKVKVDREPTEKERDCWRSSMSQLVGRTGTVVKDPYNGTNVYRVKLDDDPTICLWYFETAILVPC